MVTEDIVVLRLCPTGSCSDSKEYGCHYNYAEFAIDLKDYMGIMLRYASQTTEYMCEYCDQCLNGDNRRLEGGDNEEQDEQNENDQAGDDQQEDDGAEDEDGAQDGDGEDAEDADAEQADNGEEDYDGDADQGDDYYQYACSGWDTYCTDYSSLCVEDENDGGNLDFDGYLDYIECTQVNYNNNNYFVMPRCDGSNNKIKMVAHYDAYCTQASGNGVSIKNFGLGMSDSAFEGFYSGECIDCSESVSTDEVVRLFLPHTHDLTYFSYTFDLITELPSV
jgi:segregation and condensation protein B